MKSNIKPFSTFVNESDDLDQELRDMGFDDRQEISDFNELDEILHTLIDTDPELNAAWSGFGTRLAELIEGFDKTYLCEPSDLVELAELYRERAQDYMGQARWWALADSLVKLAKSYPD